MNGARPTLAGLIAAPIWWLVRLPYRLVAWACEPRPQRTHADLQWPPRPHCLPERQRPEPGLAAMNAFAQQDQRSKALAMQALGQQQARQQQQNALAQQNLGLQQGLGLTNAGLSGSLGGSHDALLQTLMLGQRR